MESLFWVRQIVITRRAGKYIIRMQVKNLHVLPYSCVKILQKHRTNFPSINL